MSLLYIAEVNPDSPEIRRQWKRIHETWHDVQRYASSCIYEEDPWNIWHDVQMLLSSCKVVIRWTSWRIMEPLKSFVHFLAKSWYKGCSFRDSGENTPRFCQFKNVNNQRRLYAKLHFGLSVHELRGLPKMPISCI